MSKTLELATEGTWRSNCGEIYSDAGHSLVSFVDCKYNTNYDKRYAERKANARLMAESKAMYQLLLDLQHKPMNQCAGELRRIMHSIDGEDAAPLQAVPGEEFTYERP
jgi:hypothetical protein